MKDYYEIRRLSNSMLALLSTPKVLKEWLDGKDAPKRNASFFNIGSAVDCLLTTPELWEEEFVVADIQKPGGYMADFVDNLPEGITKLSPKEDYRHAYEMSGYSIPIDRVIKIYHSKKDAKEYYHFKCGAEGKTVLTEDEYQLVLEKVAKLRESTFTKRFFAPKEHEQLLNQVPLLFEYKGFECKGLMDGILIDHESGIIKPYDVKTTGRPVFKFPDSFVKYGYFRQAAFYTLGMKLLPEFADENPDAQDLIKSVSNNYKMDLFRFVVADTIKDSPHPAVCFTTSEHDLKCGLKGGVLKKTRSRVKGINNLLDDLRWHQDNDLWEYPREIYEQGGEEFITIFDED